MINQQKQFTNNLLTSTTTTNNNNNTLKIFANSIIHSRKLPLTFVDIYLYISTSD